jgi:hypothetical protein
VGVSSLSWEMRKPTWLFFGLALAQHASLRQKVTRPMRLRRYSFEDLERQPFLVRSPRA